jgi:hypothetical protein
LIFTYLDSFCSRHSPRVQSARNLFTRETLI